MISHTEAQELHRLIGSALTDLSCMVPHAPVSHISAELEPALTRALELAAVLVSDTMGRDTDPSPVSHDPCITGTVDIGGQRSEFLLPLVDDSVRYSQWGASNFVLWPRVDLMDALAGAAREWALDSLRADCPADCSPENEDTRDAPCTECGTDWSSYDGGNYDVFRRTQQDERESND